MAIWFKKKQEINLKIEDWREVEGFEGIPEYKKRFAFLPKTCSDGSVVFLKNYYEKYLHWVREASHFLEKDFHAHTDFVENITEAEYIVRKLSDDH